MNAKVYALESIRRMRGGSQPQLMRCSDGEYYVVKFQNNPQGLRVLANELLGGLLAKLLGLPVPEVRIIEVDEYLIKYTDQMVPARVCDFLPQGMFGTVDNIADFLGMLVFDSWVGNMDQRQVVFVQNERKNLSSPYYSHHALMIDEGFCFNGCKWNFPISSKHGLFATANVYAEVSGLDVFEVWLNRLESVIDRSVLELAAFEIPLEWNDGSLQSLDRLVTKLDERRHQGRDLLCATRKAVPRFFPMWQEQIVPPRKAHAKNRIARRRVLHEKLAISLMSRYVRRLMKRS